MWLGLGPGQVQARMAERTLVCGHRPAPEPPAEGLVCFRSWTTARGRSPPRDHGTVAVHSFDRPRLRSRTIPRLVPTVPGTFASGTGNFPGLHAGGPIRPNGFSRISRMDSFLAGCHGHAGDRFGHALLGRHVAG